MRGAVFLWIVSAVVCVGRGDHHVGHDKQSQDTTMDSNNNRILVISANKEFSFILYSKLAGLSASQGKNIFFSPFSVSVALAALSVGARGETHQQLFSGLGFNSSQLTQTDVDQAFHNLLANTMSHEDVNTGTAVFVDHLFKPQPEFLDVLKQSYLSEGFNVDFSKSTDSANIINKYVSDKTNGMIDKLVDSLDPGTVMYLLSYIYYKGKWATPFDPAMTGLDEFNVDKNNKVPVQMMKMEEHYVLTCYDQALSTLVLHLPFNNSFSMLLMLPYNITTLENNISPAHVTKWLDQMLYRLYNLYVPKFSIKTSYKLNNVLKEMGMTEMFAHAELSGISEEKDLIVSSVVHQAALDVDEAGATAAAAAGIKFAPRTSIYNVQDLKFNRCFMVMILERSTENVLLKGKIVNPNL